MQAAAILKAQVSEALAARLPRTCNRGTRCPVSDHHAWLVQVHGVEVPAWAVDAQQVVKRAAAVEVPPFTPKENVRIETGACGWGMHEGDATALPKGGMRSWGAYHVSQSAPCGVTPCADPRAQQPAAEGTTPEDMVGCFAACLLPSALLRTRRCASPPLHMRTCPPGH